MDKKLNNNSFNYFYVKLPYQLIRATDSLLDKNDLLIIARLKAFTKGQYCFYSVKKWSSQILRSGDDTFYRSIYKLELLGLVKIFKNKLGESTYYKWIDDPSEWHLPKDIADRFQEEQATFALPPIEFKKGFFEHTNHFLNIFNLKHPKYKIKNPKLKEKKKKPHNQVRKPKNEEDSVWLKKLENLEEHASDVGIIYSYQTRKNEINDFSKSKIDLNLPFKKIYLKSLEARYIALNNNPPNQFIARIFSTICDLELKGLKGAEIVLNLKSRIFSDENGDKIFT